MTAHDNEDFERAPSSDECRPVTSGGHCGCWVAGGLCCMCSYGGSKSECFGPCEAADDSEDDRG